ncbi:hypothetical protein EVAR_13827_1 [Eumeta japonica]|uniref:Uncharacterized protein n=1 Tax=Eumeta variegata TaxID=151549 RepID=A0A4C1U1E8_EUMVA|nr:hypothetical protein EVAR_13827_1 [Eumeta japonica]
MIRYKKKKILFVYLFLFRYRLTWGAPRRQRRSVQVAHSAPAGLVSRSRRSSRLVIHLSVATFIIILFTLTFTSLTSMTEIESLRPERGAEFEFFTCPGTLRGARHSASGTTLVMAI